MSPAPGQRSIHHLVCPSSPFRTSLTIAPAPSSQARAPHCPRLALSECPPTASHYGLDDMIGSVVGLGDSEKLVERPIYHHRKTTIIPSVSNHRLLRALNPKFPMVIVNTSWKGVVPHNTSENTDAG